MKIAVVGPTYPYRGGIAHYTTMLVRSLRQRGHQTSFYSFTRQYPRWLFPGKTDADPSSAPLRVECEYLLDPINPLTWWRLYRRVRHDNPEILLLQWWVPYWTPSLTMIGRWIKRNTRIHILFVCHNVVPHEGGGFLDWRLGYTVLRQGDAFIVHSEQDRYYLQALLPRAQVWKAHLPTFNEVVTPDANRSSSSLRAELGVPDGVPVIMFFGFVRPYKGLEYLVRALPMIVEHMQVHLLVVGEFWISPAFYMHYAEEFAMQEHMTLVNRYVPNEDLQTYFAMADVVVLPYVSATQSAVVQLAFGCGKAVITTRVGGLHEVVEDGVTGLIVPPQDSQALAEAVLRFFREGLREPFEENVRCSSETLRFSWEHMVTTIEQVHQSFQEH